MKRLSRYCLVCIWLFLIPPVEGSEGLGICNDFENQPVHFESLYRQSRALGQSICLSVGEVSANPTLDRAYVEFAMEAARQVADTFGETDFSEPLQQQMEHFIELAEKGVNRKTLPPIEVRESTELFSSTLLVGFVDWNERAEVDAETSECEPADCATLLNALAIAINQYQYPYARLEGARLGEYGKELSLQWIRYAETSRAQTLWDITFTSFMENRRLARGPLSGPMARQYFIVHPSLILEYVDEVDPQEKLAQALAIEWLGINWWDSESSPLGIPVGVSVASVYSSRVSTEDIGHGVLFHFFNNVSLGVTSRKGKLGAVLTLDLLSLIARGEERSSRYLSDLEERIESAIPEIEGRD